LQLIKSLAYSEKIEAWPEDLFRVVPKHAPRPIDGYGLQPVSEKAAIWSRGDSGVTEGNPAKSDQQPTLTYANFEEDSNSISTTRATLGICSPVLHCRMFIHGHAQPAGFSD
jgi:hypothetical protein